MICYRCKEKMQFIKTDNGFMPYCFCSDEKKKDNKLISFNGILEENLTRDQLLKIISLQKSEIERMQRNADEVIELMGARV